MDVSSCSLAVSSALMMCLMLLPCCQLVFIDVATGPAGLPVRSAGTVGLPVCPQVMPADPVGWSAAPQVLPAGRTVFAS